jgi:hypothetical protein
MMRGTAVNGQPATRGKFLGAGVAACPAAKTGLADPAKRCQRLILLRPRRPYRIAGKRFPISAKRT